ncbi:ATPase, AAA family protein [Trichomonas vaginalis G3]|uniref:ATPase, AAA family protein n=1 Tax=Trichomonas vaginalis (strain ATCC PRA-98 / G3) TaxID=412133 RepID=A2F521_TRIV3|nr:AAA-family ATPase family [Trichomonas vaginalis G3]EAY00025.1 ATPase, AAA family protein [Trichomonas vaginalis G3]KAI5523526.1 AAA-family ATPase family [Trichomonas vaginalis G3]|eukprot:XP_001312954.1 ATPase, AAA family protein [Trichomonas vaginalis G3]
MKGKPFKQADAFPYFKEMSEKNGGYIDVNAVFEQLKQDHPEFTLDLQKVTSYAANYARDNGCKVGTNKLAPKKEPKQVENEFTPVEPQFTFADVGGLDNQKMAIYGYLSQFLGARALHKSINVSPICGILLHGPSGCGKTLFAEAAVGEFASNVKFFKTSATNFFSAQGGQGEAKIRALFQAASTSPNSVIFIDDIDLLSGNKTSHLAEQLAQCMDNCITSKNYVFVIGATHKIEKLPKCIRNTAKFTKEIAIGIPDKEGRAAILQALIHDVKNSSDVNIDQIATEAEGYVGADLNALVKEAGFLAVQRAMDNNQEDTEITNQDYISAIDRVQPSLRREGFTTNVAPVSFDKIGGLEDVKKELSTAIIDAIVMPDIFKAYDHKPASGIILYGPPGCGKTLLARAIAHEAYRAAFISVKGPELLNKYLGESESAIRGVFSRARDSAPCVIFFDEIDAICPRRSDDSSNAAASRVVNQLLTEMDGLVGRGQVFVIGATNRLELVDEAMLRPGRLDKKIEVPKPDFNGRCDILRKKLERIVCKRDDIDVERISELTDGFSGAEIDALVTEAAEFAINEMKKKIKEDLPECNDPTEISKVIAQRIRELSPDQWCPVTQEHLLAGKDKIIANMRK